MSSTSTTAKETIVGLPSLQLVLRLEATSQAYGVTYMGETVSDKLSTARTRTYLTA